MNQDVQDPNFGMLESGNVRAYARIYMKSTKWKKFRFSKDRFKTKVVVNANKGQLIVGSDTARAHLERMLGHKISLVKEGGEWVFRSERFNWCFMRPLKAA